MCWINTVVHRKESNSKPDILSGETQWRLTKKIYNLMKSCIEATILQFPTIFWTRWFCLYSTYLAFVPQTGKQMSSNKIIKKSIYYKSVNLFRYKTKTLRDHLSIVCGSDGAHCKKEIVSCFSVPVAGSECSPKRKGWASCATSSPSLVPIQTTVKSVRLSSFFSRHMLWLVLSKTFGILSNCVWPWRFWCGTQASKTN